MHIDRRFAFQTVTAAVICALVVVAFLLLWFGRTFFLLGFAGLLVALVLGGASARVARWLHLPHGVALSLLLALLVGAFVGLGWLMAPNLAEQVDRLGDALPRSLEALEASIRQYAWGRELLDLMPPEDLWQGNPDPLSRITGVFSVTAGFFANVVIVFFLGVFIAYAPGTYFGAFLRLVPGGCRERTRDVLRETAHTLRLWFLGRLISMVFVGVATGVALALLGVPLALSLGTLAMLFAFVPYLGPIVTTIPIVLIALLEGGDLALWAFVAYVAVQSIEGYLVTPLVQYRAVSLPPAMILASQILFGLLFGLLGVALSTPLTAAAAVLVNRFYVEDVLGDRVGGADA